VDGVYIDCSFQKQVQSHRCTVYRDKTGEVLADGWFVASNSNGGLETSDLQYAAFGNRHIYLENAQTLVLKTLAKNDPEFGLLDNALRGISARDSTKAIDCGESGVNGDFTHASNCAVDAVAARKPFYVRFYTRGWYSYSLYGLVGDENGNVAYVFYDRFRRAENSNVTSTQTLDPNQIQISTCPKPVTLVKEDGVLSCSRPLP
jgi:hypothetical protein